MADLTDKEAAIASKITGVNSSGTETNFVDATANGGLHTNLRNNSGTEIGTSLTPLRTDPTGTTTQPISSLTEGTVTPGTVATKSELAGMQYNTAAPAPANGQQLAMQSTSDGRLKVDANFSVLGGQLVPTITNKMRVRYSTTPATVGSAYSTIYTRSGTGLFFGFQADFNSAKVRLRLTIDSGQIFEITIEDLKLFQFNDTSTTRMQMGGFWATIGNTVDFSTKYAIPYTTSVTIEMQRSDATNHTMNQYMVLLTEDT